MGPVVTTFMTTDAQAYGAAQKIQNGGSPIESTPANDSFTEELSLNWGRLGWQLLSATPAIIRAPAGGKERRASPF